MATINALGIEVHVETWNDEQVETIVCYTVLPVQRKHGNK